MTHAASFNRLFSGGALKRDGARVPDLRAQRFMRLGAPLQDDELRGKVQRSGSSPSALTPLSKGLDARLGAAKRVGYRVPGRTAPNANFDARQRAIVKIHFFGHGGGGGAALLAHGRYVAREAARGEIENSRALDADDANRAHADYLERDQKPSFYDALTDNVDGRARMAVWADEDRRHFRIILSAENGVELGELRAYTRSVMERAEKILGARLEWVSVNHHDTDNPHTHIVVRGRHQNGRALILPREFVQRGLRDIARDVATERLGARTQADGRRALLREARAHRPTRLDALLAKQLNGDRLRMAALRASNRDPELTRALKLRARELLRLGLALEHPRNVLTFVSGWRDRLRAMELHLDIRKRLVIERTQQRDATRRLRGLMQGPDR